MDSFLYYIDKKNELNLNKYDIDYLKNAFNQNNFDPVYLVILNYKLSLSQNPELKEEFRSEVAKNLQLEKTKIQKYWQTPLSLIKPSHTVVTPFPIVLFTYNRLETLQKTIDSLLLNQESIDSELIIFSDGPNLKIPSDFEKVKLVRNFLKEIEGFKSISIHESKENLGLEKSITDGLNKVSNEYEAFIVLEDDLILSPYFLNFINRSLETYRNEERVWCINGMSAKQNILNFSTSFPEPGDFYWTYRAFSHGWGSWSNRWNSIELDEQILRKSTRKFNNRKNIKLAGKDLLDMFEDQLLNKIDSWAIKWVINIAINKGVCLTPLHSYVSHQYSVPGTHIKRKAPHLTNELFNVSPNFNLPKTIKVNPLINSAYNQYIYFKRSNRNIRYRLFTFFKNKFTF